jgi:hypothetical protein
MSLRGTEVAMFDYAFFGRKFLRIEPVIVTRRWNRKHRWGAYRRFRQEFPVRFYGEFEDAHRAMVDCEAVYALRGGGEDWQIPGVRNLFHGVFRDSVPMGDRFAYISPFLSRECPGDHPYVPHMVWMPPPTGDLRAKLKIPSDALVFGRYGGHRTFDLPFVHRLVYDAVETFPNVWFLFLNTVRFGPRHPRVVHLPGTAYVQAKANFVNTCDAMLHAREDGETFGLAIGEFSVLNRPVFTWSGSHDGAHYEFLGERGFFYEDAASLWKQIEEFDPVSARGKDWDCYSEQFGPEPVMRKFGEVFLGSRVAQNLERLS